MYRNRKTSQGTTYISQAVTNHLAVEIKDAKKPHLFRQAHINLPNTLKEKPPQTTKTTTKIFTMEENTLSYFLYTSYPRGSLAFLDVLYAVPWGYFYLYYYRWLQEHKGKLSSSTPGEPWVKSPVIQTEAPRGHHWICASAKRKERKIAKHHSIRL